MRDNVILGMPASGKSTFIAALSYILFSDEVETVLRSELTEEEGYVSALQKRWLLYEELKHTPTAGQTWITFKLSARDGSTTMELELPDFSGESLKSAVVTGIYPEELADSLRNSSGIFLFTSAAGKDDDVLLNDYFDFLAEDDLEQDEVVEPAVVESSDGIAAGTTPSVEIALQRSSEPAVGQDGKTVKKAADKLFDPMEMPEQVKTVQLLQTVDNFERRRRKLVIMISAWDVVSSESKDIAPSDWLENNRAMLWQYLNFNPLQWDVRIYGVSAQGGRLPDDKANLSKIVKPSERVQLVGHGASAHDLTEPLFWMAT